MRLRPQDYQYRRLVGVEISPPVRCAFHAFGVLVIVVLINLLPDWAVRRWFTVVEDERSSAPTGGRA